MRLLLMLQRLRAAREEGGRRSGSEVLGRFLVTKLSWRGSYRRLLCITPTHITTLYPDTLAVTNSWAFAGDHDLAGVEVGGDHAEGGLLTLHFRRDKKVRRRRGCGACRADAARRPMSGAGCETPTLLLARGGSEGARCA
jgi:hypothetical protein